MKYVKYMDRYVPEDGFRVFIYRKKDNSPRLVDSYQEYIRLIRSGHYKDRR